MSTHKTSRDTEERPKMSGIRCTIDDLRLVVKPFAIGRTATWGGCICGWTYQGPAATCAAIWTAMDGHLGFRMRPEQLDRIQRSQVI